MHIALYGHMDPADHHTVVKARPAGASFWQKNTPLDFQSMYLVDFVNVCRFQCPSQHPVIYVPATGVLCLAFNQIGIKGATAKPSRDKCCWKTIKKCRYGPIWSHMDHMDSYVPIWDHMGHMGPTWVHMDPYGSHMGPYCIWVPYGSMWAHTDPMDSYGPIWVPHMFLICMFGFKSDRYQRCYSQAISRQVLLESN